MWLLEDLAVEACSAEKDRRYVEIADELGFNPDSLCGSPRLQLARQTQDPGAMGCSREFRGERDVRAAPDLCTPPVGDSLHSTARGSAKEA